MKGVLAISKDGDRFTAVEKSITDGTVADTMSFELREILNFHCFLEVPVVRMMARASICVEAVEIR